MVWILKEDDNEVRLTWLLHNEQPRSVGIVLPAIMDNRLQRAIDSRLKKEKASYNALFGSAKPLSSFMAKLDMGMVLGLYGPEFYREMEYINRARNKFAHFLDAVDFDTNIVANCIRELKYFDVQKFPNFYPKLGRPDDPLFPIVMSPPDLEHGTWSNRRKFIKSVELMVYYLFVVGSSTVTPAEPLLTSNDLTLS